MFDLPDTSVDEIGRFADWVEFCTLFEKTGLVSKTELADVVADAGLIGSLAEDVFTRDVTYIEPDDFSEDDATERFADLVFEELSVRKSQAGDSYPFLIERESLRRSAASWENIPGFSLLLIADISRSYQKAGVIIEANTKFSVLFEKVVEAATKGLLSGRSARFGWPIEPGWPTPIDDRIRILGQKLELEVEKLGGKTRPKDSDRGLDVVAQLSFGDDGPATLFLLTQCATGKNWTKKKGEPSLKEWDDIFRWNAQLLRAIAVPWRLGKGADAGFDRTRTFRHFDGVVVLDRPRLAAGGPDRYIDPKITGPIRDWCGGQLKKFPKLK